MMTAQAAGVATHICYADGHLLLSSWHQGNPIVYWLALSL
jgi:hypothetical protein